MLTNELYNKLPDAGKKFYQDTYLNSYTRTGNEFLAEQVATEMVKSKLVRENGMLVAMSEAFTPQKLYSFTLDTNVLKVVHNADGDITVEAVLANTNTNVEGHFFTEEELHELSAQINAEGSTNPDTEHELLKKLEAMIPILRSRYGSDDEAIKEAFKKEMIKSKGTFKSIISTVKDGKLWIQAKLDKSYRAIVGNLKHVSIEAMADNDNGRLRKPKYVGFTFAKLGKLPGAMVTSVA